jgi:hypothetical protein
MWCSVVKCAAKAVTERSSGGRFVSLLGGTLVRRRLLRQRWGCSLPLRKRQPQLASCWWRIGDAVDRRPSLTMPAAKGPERRRSRPHSSSPATRDAQGLRRNHAVEQVRRE